MNRKFESYYEQSQSHEDDVLLDADFDQDGVDDLSVLAVHNEQIHRVLREY